MDELFSFKERKNSNLHHNFGKQKTRKIFGYDIADNRSIECIQCLVDNSSKANFYFSDAFPVYSQICYDGSHKSLKNKSQTFTVDSVNADFL